MTQCSVKFSAVGDITLGDHPLTVGFGAFSRFHKEDQMFPFLKTQDVLQQSDLLFGNLECAHSWEGLRSGDYKSVQMRGDPRHIEALVTTGFKVVNVANNHSMQHGNDAFLDTIQKLQSANIFCCGMAANAMPTSAKPITIQINGVSVGFLGYSLRPRQYFEHVPLYAEGEPEAMVRDVQALRSQVDVVVVSVHWGEEFIQRPSPKEIRTCPALGGYWRRPHYWSPPACAARCRVPWTGLHVYSLGNFVCDMVWDDTLCTSVIFECTITKHGIQDINLVRPSSTTTFSRNLSQGIRRMPFLNTLIGLVRKSTNRIQPILL